MTACRHSAGQGAHPVYAPHLKEGEVQCSDCGHITPAPDPMTFDDCLDGPVECQGAVEYRYALSGTGKSYPRCDRHWSERVLRQEEIDRRYPTHAPSDFDPAYAGERWDDDY
jgi:hypothetical protein